MLSFRRLAVITGQQECCPRDQHSGGMTGKLQCGFVVANSCCGGKLAQRALWQASERLARSGGASMLL